MFASPTTKDSRKHKKKIQRQNIADGIPEAPQLSDFTVHYTNSETSDDLQDSEEVLVDSENVDSKNKDVEATCSQTKVEDVVHFDTPVIVGKVDMSFASHGIDIVNDMESLQITHVEEASSSVGELEKENSEIYDYNELRNQVKCCAYEIYEPSAPQINVDSDEHIASTSHLVFEEPPATILDLKERELDEYIIGEIIDDLVVPFTETELSIYYHNSRINQCEEYINEFVQDELTNPEKVESELYILLDAYLKSRKNLNANEKLLQELQKSLDSKLPYIWSVQDVVLTETEKCRDGNQLIFSKTYKQASMNIDVYESFKFNLKQVKELLFEVYMWNSFQSSVLKLKIDTYLHRLRTSCSDFTNLDDDSHMKFVHSSDVHLMKCIADLKTSISILFLFQRLKKIEKDVVFTQLTRHWLSDLVAILIRVGDWKDQIFLLNHILRCPGGVGKWAAHYIQTPFDRCSMDPISALEVNYMMTVLSVILRQIVQRENFLQDWKITKGEENPWVLVDSDGEDDDQEFCPLKENDLVLLLNQIPFDYIFQQMLVFQNGQCGDLSVHRLLRLFAFCTDFITIVHSGLQLYSSQKYKQFTKRLGRLIRHAVQYATHAFVIFKKSKFFTEEELNRLQAEYDNFFLKSTKYIYSSQRYGAWQFLAVVPYNMASKNAILKLHSILQFLEDATPKILHINLNDFEEKFVILPECEQFYLLTTFTNMALARDLSELDFIKVVTLQILYIGFFGHYSKNQCYKNAKSLLFNICSVHPFLMSEILKNQNDRFSSDPKREQNLSVYLWMELPVDIWLPEDKDLEILKSWLLEPIQSVQSELARTILRSLNYDFKNNELFLEPHVHLSVALMVMQANVKLIPDVELYSVRNVMRNQAPELSLQNWSWNLLMKLRLHLVDRIDGSFKNSFQNLYENLITVPDVESLNQVHQLMEKKHPIACFIALIGTTLGHSVPLLFNRSFELVEVLWNSSKHEVAITCIEKMTLMFVQCSDSLYKCEKFMSVLSQIIAADNSYLRIAKNLISSDFPGVILKSFGNMIQSQINNFRKFELNIQALIELWISCLTKIPLWSQEPGILNLVDLLVKNSFLDQSSYLFILSYFKILFEDTKSPSETKSSFSSLVSWMNATYTPATLLPPKGYNGAASWLSYVVLEIEFEANEQNNSLWSELLQEIHSSLGRKANIDSSLKKTCNILQIPARPSSILSIYKYSQQILEADISHPLLILFWQKFFYLYLARVSGPIDKGSVGEKFFEGIVNQTLFKRLKSRLQETRNYVNATLVNCKDEEKKSHILNCSELLEAFTLWLDEPRLHEPFLNLHSLPTPCKSVLLSKLIHRDNTPWLEYLDYKEITEELKISRTKNLTEKRTVLSAHSKSEEKSPNEEIADCLKSYETPLKPPKLNTEKGLLPRIGPVIFLQSSNMTSFVKRPMKNLLDHSFQFLLNMNRHEELIHDLTDLPLRLYKGRQKKISMEKHCTDTNSKFDGVKHLTCKGPASVTLSFEEFELDKSMDEYFKQCFKKYDNEIQVTIKNTKIEASLSAVHIYYTINELIREYRLAIGRSDEIAIKTLEEVGSNLFYDFIKSWVRDLTGCPFISKTFYDYIGLLGTNFISGKPQECSRLLDTLLKHPDFVDDLSLFFTPNVADNISFISMYGNATKASSKLVVNIVSKFDIQRWLEENKPKFFDREDLIFFVMESLKADGSGPSQIPELRKILNSHLEILLLYDFPEHYGSILNVLLDASASQSISTSTWFTFLNALAPSGMSISEGYHEEKSTLQAQYYKKLKQNFSKYATKQTRLSFIHVKETIRTLAHFFKTDRLNHGLHGLYPKYRPYIEPILTFFGMLSHACVVGTLEADLGSLSISIAEQLWLMLEELYSPWLVPYWTQNKKTSPASWIQDLTDDRCLLLPWGVNNCCDASFTAKIFVDSIQFVLDTLPGVHSTLSYLWCFYVTNFAHPRVKEHILGAIHIHLNSLPWNSFFPSLQDVELMLKVVDQFLPICHSFLGSVFVEVNWTDLVQQYLNIFDIESNTRLHICLLNLLVKLPSEPTLKQNKRITMLLTEANEYAWHLVDSNSYDSVLNWFVMSCDPRIILMDEKSEYFQLDSLILRLLQSCAGYSTTAKQFHPTTLTKRLMFVRASVKWLITANSKFKSKKSVLFKSALCTIWSDIENILTATVPHPQRIDEAGILLSEFLNILKEPDVVPLVEETWICWLESRKAGVVVYALLRSASVCISDPLIFGKVTEACLNSYFDSVENSDWLEVVSISSFSHSSFVLENSLLKSENFLTLYSFWLKKLQDSKEKLMEKVILNDIFLILSSVKPSEVNEPKLILFIIQALKLIDNQKFEDKTQTKIDLMRLYEMLSMLANQRGSGFLSTLGLKRATSPSIRLKLVCLATGGGIMTLFRSLYLENQDAADEKISLIMKQIDHKQFQNISQYAEHVKDALKGLQTLGELTKFLNLISTKLFNKMYLK